MTLNGKRRKVWWLLALVVVIAAIWGWRILNAPLPQYQTLVARKSDLQQSVLATGKLDALRKVDVGAQVSGQLKTLRVNIGDKVQKDQLLGVIDPEQAENQIKEVDATLMELRAQLETGAGRTQARASNISAPAAVGAASAGFSPGSGYRRHRCGGERGANRHHRSADQTQPCDPRHRENQPRLYAYPGADVR